MKRKPVSIKSDLPDELPDPPRPVCLRKGLASWAVWLFLPPFCVLMVVFDLYVGDYVVAFALAPRFGTPAPGRITEKSTYTTKGKRPQTQYRITFTYRVNDRTEVAHSDVGFETHRRARVGDPLQVRVLPSLFANHAYVEEPGFGAIGDAQCGWAFLCLSLNAILALSLSGCITRRASRSLVMRGTATTGWIVKKEVGAWRRLCFVYRFRTPAATATEMGVHADDGVEHLAVMCVERSDYEEAQPGQAVTVLYDPRNPRRSVIYRFAEYQVVGVHRQTFEGNKTTPTISAVEDTDIEREQQPAKPHWTATNVSFADDLLDERITRVPKAIRLKDVDSAPAPAQPSLWFEGDPKHRDHHQELSRPDADRMVLGPKKAYLWLVAFFALVPVGVAFMSLEATLGVGFLFGFIALFPAGIYLVVPRWTFCRNTGQLIYKGAWNQRTYRLRKILAIQVCFGGVFHIWHRGGSSTPYDTYQMNLVIDDPAESRINLTHHMDLEWTLLEAKQLADFLGVPLMDQHLAL